MITFYDQHIKQGKKIHTIFLESWFSRKTEPVGCIYIEKETCNKELVHVIKEVSKSQGLQSELASWRDDDVVPV